MTAIAGLMSWFGICIVCIHLHSFKLRVNHRRRTSWQTYLRFRAGWNAQGLDRTLLPYQSSFQPYAAWYGLIMIVIILLLSGFSVFLPGNWNTANFVTNYVPLMSAPILFVVASFVMRSKFVGTEDMDFVTGLDEVISTTYEDPPSRNIWEKFWSWIVSVPLRSFPPERIALLVRGYSPRCPQAQSVQGKHVTMTLPFPFDIEIYKTSTATRRLAPDPINR